MSEKLSYGIWCVAGASQNRHCDYPAGIITTTLGAGKRKPREVQPLPQVAQPVKVEPITTSLFLDWDRLWGKQLKSQQRREAPRPVGPRVQQGPRQHREAGRALWLGREVEVLGLSVRCGVSQEGDLQAEH